MEERRMADRLIFL